jgi:hypothetical protein
LGQKKTKIFLQKGLDSQITDLPSGNCRRHSRHPEVRAVFGAPRRMLFKVVLAAILQGARGRAPQDDGSS